MMRLALDEAGIAAGNGEVPVGALITHDGVVIATGSNNREHDNDPTAHAEVVAIRRAAKQLRSWRLDNCALYVTLEPCPMCAGAILQARIPTVVYGTTDPKAGAVHTLYRLLNDSRLNHRCEVIGGVLADECGEILSEFFQARRAESKK
ncbi:MAG: tRNA adenosine(34) deaminase TadA [Planctomycetaceae bacterium]|nr:tRNA adenosine(34) deaminase TadA [Planctomycetaceae bacterium]